MPRPEEQVRGRGEAGFAAVDALVALTILAVSITMSLGALATASRVGAAAVEAERATTLLRYLLDRELGPNDATSGLAQGFAWRVNMGSEPNLSAAQVVLLCTRTAELRSIRSARRYALSETVMCPQKPA